MFLAAVAESGYFDVQILSRSRFVFLVSRYRIEGRYLDRVQYFLERWKVFYTSLTWDWQE